MSLNLNRKSKPDRHHTPVKNPDPKKMKQTAKEDEISNRILFNVIQSLTRKFDA